MHVLITRPKDDAEPLKSKIEQLGWRVSLEPLIRVVRDPIPPSAVKNAATLIVTSRNALRSLAASPALQHAIKLPLLAVGPGTGSLAREIGFQTVFEGAGTGADLVPEIMRRSASGGPFLYLSGDVLAFDLPKALAEKKVNVRRIITYRSVAAETLSPITIDALKRRDIDVVTLMSPRTAATWGKLVSDLPADLSEITYVCLSENVANALRSGLPTSKILTAARPNLEELFIVLKRLAARPEAE